MNPNELKCGEVLTFVRECLNPVGFQFHVGNKITLIEPTSQSPHGFTSPVSNWLCDGPNGTTVWSSIYWCLEVGILKRA